MKMNSSKWTKVSEGVLQLSKFISSLLNYVFVLDLDLNSLSQLFRYKIVYLEICQKKSSCSVFVCAVSQYVSFVLVLSLKVWSLHVSLFTEACESKVLSEKVKVDPKPGNQPSRATGGT